MIQLLLLSLVFLSGSGLRIVCIELRVIVGVGHVHLMRFGCLLFQHFGAVVNSCRATARFVEYFPLLHQLFGSLDLLNVSGKYVYLLQLLVYVLLGKILGFLDILFLILKLIQFEQVVVFLFLQLVHECLDVPEVDFVVIVFV